MSKFSNFFRIFAVLVDCPHSTLPKHPHHKPLLVSVPGKLVSSAPLVTAIVISVCVRVGTRARVRVRVPPAEAACPRNARQEGQDRGASDEAGLTPRRRS